MLVSGSTSTATDWVRRGVVPCHVATHPSWTVVSPAAPRTAVPEPYDDALTVLAARHVPTRLAPAIGLFAIGGAVVVTAQGPGWRAVKRWALRGRQREMVRGPDLPALRPEDLHRVLATASGQRLVHLSDVVALWGRSDLTDREWLVEATHVLGLPGGRVLDGSDDAPGPRIDPDRRAAGAFQSAVKDVSE